MMDGTCLYLLVLVFLGLCTYGTGTLSWDWFKSGQEELKKALLKNYNTNKAKNVILFVGDGMGLSTVTAARILRGQQNGKPGEEGYLVFEEFPSVGLSKVYTVDRQVPDSAATATAMLSGVKTKAYTVGVNDRATFLNCSSQTGAEVESIINWFTEAGRATGIVTTSRITHATPAAAYAHAASRQWEGDVAMRNLNLVSGENCKDIAYQLIHNASIQVIFGGGRRYFLREQDLDPEVGRSQQYFQRKDNESLVKIWKARKEKDKLVANYVWNNRQFDAINTNKADVVLGLFSPDHMSFEADRDRGPKGEPSLANMTAKAINILQKYQNGFFLLVEGARIDHAHHNNNGKRALLETLAFEDAIKEALRLTSESDTLMVVTADHSHVFNIAGHPQRGNDILGLVQGPDIPKDNLPYTTLIYGNGPGYNWFYRRNLFRVDTTDINYQQAAAVPLDYETHAGEDVPIYARGPMSHLFNGVHEQHYIAHAMAYAACVGANKQHCLNNQSAPQRKSRLQRR